MNIRIGVLMGGLSIEKEVSLSSGRTVCDHLDTNRYTAVPLFQTEENKLYILPWKFLYRGKISDFKHRLSGEAQEIIWDDLHTIIDFMYIAQHGRYAEDGRLQGLLEVLNIPYLGSKVFASAVGMDKVFQKKILKAHNIATPKSITVYPAKTLNEQRIYTDFLESDLKFPVIIKPAQEGSSLGITLATTQEEFLSAVYKAMHIDPANPQAVLAEEQVLGMEFTCITLIDPKTKQVTALPPTEIVKEQDKTIHDYEQKYMPGRAQKFTPARCNSKTIENIQAAALAVTKALQFSTISRIDGFVKTDGSIVIIDPNTLCGMAPSSFFFNQAAQIGMSHTDIINHLITSELSGYTMTLTPHEFTTTTNTHDHKKIRIGVLLGGASNERETSLNSGRNVCYKLSPHKYEITPLFLDSKLQLYPLEQKLLVHNTTAEIEYDLDRSTKITWASLPKQFDFIFIALHGGAGENGSIQGMLEMLNMPYNGSGVLASSLAMNKYETNRFLESEGFDIPQHFLVAQEDWQHNQEQICSDIANKLNFPMVVKPHDDGCSVMVYKATNSHELQEQINLLFSNNKAHAFVEEFIVGTELTVGVVGNQNAQALPPSQTVARDGILSMEEKFLPGAGENQTPALLPAPALLLVQTTMENIYKAVGCTGYARIDCFYQSPTQSPTGKERVIVLEINSLPALTPATCLFHQAAEVGIKPMELIDMFVTLGFEKHTKHQVIKQPEETLNI